MPLSVRAFLGILALALLSMLAFSLLGRRPDADAARKGSRFALGLSSCTGSCGRWARSSASPCAWA